MTAPLPTVTVAVPVLNEARHIEACLASITAQTYSEIVEVLVVDGGSEDGTPSLAASFPKVRVLENHARIQSVSLNLALSEAQGTVIVRVDGHCQLAPDYVERCVEGLRRTGAAMVGGAMCPLGEGWVGQGIAAALTSRLGAGPARFHTGGASGFVDTVYLGAFRRQLAIEVGGYAEDMAINEDAEFALRMQPHGGVWFDDTIKSTYTPRRSFTKLARQFYRYGRGRADTVRRHPRSISPRQLTAPLLVLSLVAPWRFWALAVYLVLVAARASWELRRSCRSALGLLVAIPAMHLPWGAGFLRGLCIRRAGSGTERLPAVSSGFVRP